VSRSSDRAIFLDTIGQSMGYRFDNIYSAAASHYSDERGSISRKQSLFDMLLPPVHDPVKLPKRESALFQVLKRYFGNMDIYQRYRHPDIMYSLQKKGIELDIFLPRFALAFEYQGEYHYHLHHYFGSSPKRQYARDKEKKDVRDISLCSLTL
jgi:hypothetical protein